MQNSFFKKHAIPSDISTYLSRTLIVITVAATFLIGGVLIFEQTLYFDRIGKQKATEYIEDQKSYIKEIVKNEITYIENQDAAFEKKIKNKIKQNVSQAYYTAENIYNKYSGKKSEEEIKSLIIGTISSMRFEREYEQVFISSLDGTGIFYARHPEFTGATMQNFKDSNGVPVVMKEIALLSEKDEGFLDYHLPQFHKGENHHFEKITFVKKFGHFGWYFGSKQYVDDYYQSFVDEIAQKISSVRFRHGGYVFMNNINGTPIVMDGEVYRGKLNFLNDSTDARHSIFQQQLDLASSNPEGGYFTYQWNKIGNSVPIEKCSYVQPYPKYNWIIGAGLYLDEIQQIISTQQKTLRADQQKNIAIILAIFLLLLGLEAAIIYNFNKQYKADFERFFNFFYLSNENFNTIDPSEFYFDEFKRAAIEANNMVEQRKMIEGKLIEEQKKATESDRLKSAFLANMSHEIRTPMNAIVGFSELLEDEAQNLQDKSLFIRLIKKNGEILLNLINDIIDISKIEANLLSVKKRSVELNHFLDEVESHFTELIASQREKKVSFEIKRNIPENFLINTDEIRLRQIMNNLIGNAVKFTSSGTINVTVEGKDQFIKFCISDTGIGIPTHQQRTIFERFMQADQGKMNFGGNGLGLAISKNLIELLGGTISVESEPGKGSCFYFSISTT